MFFFYRVRITDPSTICTVNQPVLCDIKVCDSNRALCAILNSTYLVGDLGVGVELNKSTSHVHVTFFYSPVEGGLAILSIKKVKTSVN